MSSVKDAPTTHTASRTYPIDRFDEVVQTSRVGAHRISGRSRAGSLILLVGGIVTVLLIIAGAFWVNTVGGDGTSGITPDASETSRPEAAAPVLDSTAPVAVLNGTQIPSLQDAVGTLIAENGWGKLAFADYAATNEVQISAVFYQDPALEPAARGLALQLGGVSTYQTDEYAAFGVSFVVLLGSDYAGPGIAEAQGIVDASAVIEEPLPLEDEPVVDPVQ